VYVRVCVCVCVCVCVRVCAPFPRMNGCDCSNEDEWRAVTRTWRIGSTTHVSMNVIQ
jgi:hypothetical protein